MARPAIKVSLLGATPQMREPTSKIKMLNMKTSLTGKYLKAFPHIDWVAATGRKRADAYQPTSASDWNWSVIVGMAVEMMVRSSEAKKMLRIRATTMDQNRMPLGYSLSSIS